MKRFVLPAIAILIAATFFIAGRVTAGEWFPSDNSVEAGFARDMAIHHAQAVQMTELARRKPLQENIRLLASDIAITQQAQLGQMQGWLAVWGLPISTDEPSMQWAGHAGGHMKGMATSEQLHALEDSSPPETEKQFLRLMIPHHEGGAEMAKAALDRSGNKAVRHLAQAILDSQTAEVETMKKMLNALDTGAPIPDSHSH